MQVKFVTEIEDGLDRVRVTTQHEAEDRAPHVAVNVNGSTFDLSAEAAEALSNAIRAHVNRRFM